MRIYFKVIAGCLLYLFVACNSNSKPVSRNDNQTIVDSINYQSGDTVKPFKNYDFNQGLWKAQIKISPDDDIDLSSRVPNQSVFSTTNKKILNQIKDWGFIYTEGDMTTVVNKFNLFKDDSLIVSYGIVLDRNSVGLQSRRYGWMPALDSNIIFEAISLFGN